MGAGHAHALYVHEHSVVHRMGFAQSRRAARQLVRHRHIEVNGTKVDVHVGKLHDVHPGVEIFADVDVLLLAPRMGGEHARDRFLDRHPGGAADLEGIRGREA